MRRRPALLLWLLILTGLSVSLRHDLAALARHGGDARLAGRDLPGAAAWYRRAGVLGHNRALVAGGLGAVYYRSGDYQQALQHFSAALATAGPGQRPSLHYNRGNSAYRLAQKLIASDRPGAARLFRQAMADYGATLSAEPGASDAATNLSRAKAGLAEVTAVRGGQPVRKKEMALGTQAAKGPGAERPAGSASPPGPSAVTPKAAPCATEKAGTGDAEMPNGKTRRDMSRSEAERLLNESRAKEKLSGPPLGTSRHTLSQQPAQDW